MTATVAFHEFTSASSTSVANNINFGSTNSANLSPSQYPMEAGTYSYSKWIAAYFTGSFTNISALKFNCSASGAGYVTGETIKFNGTTASYTGTSNTASVVPTTSADVQANNAMVFSTPASANIGISGSLTGSLTGTGYSDFIVLQTSVTTSASSGSVVQKTFTLSYTET